MKDAETELGFAVICLLFGLGVLMVLTLCPPVFWAPALVVAIAGGTAIRVIINLTEEEENGKVQACE